ncbi:MAG: hypothetical protein OWT28_04310 [Firmicutes bacterium]|nr:hypothetical protein [Bacillota bacterium]
MRNPVLSPWALTPILMIYAVWAVLFHQLVLTAWTLQYSYLGVIGILVAAAIVFVSFPRLERKPLLYFTAYAMLVGIGLSNVLTQVSPWNWIDLVVFLVLALPLGRYVVRLHILQVLLVVASVIALELWVPFADMSVLSAFSLRYEASLAPPSPLNSNVPDALTATTAENTNPTITTLAALPVQSAAKKTLLQAISAFTPGQSTAARADLLDESLAIAALTRVPSGGYHLQAATEAQLQAVPFTSLTLSDFPFHTAHIISTPDKQLRVVEPITDSPTTLLSMLLNPDTLPLTAARLTVESARTTANSWSAHVAKATPQIDGLSVENGVLHGTFHGQAVHIQTRGVTLLGVASFAPSLGRAAEAMVEGNNVLQVVTLPPDRVRILSTLVGSYIHPLTSDIQFGDVLGNHTDALLINTVPAQIVVLTPQNKWKTLWSSGQASFRFEATTHQTSNRDLLIANAPALYSTNPTRYLGGYVYSNHQLERVFRVYRANLINVHAVSHAMSGWPTIMATVFDQPAIMVLEPSSIPWLTLVDLGFAILIITGLVRRIRRRTRHEAV